MKAELRVRVATEGDDQVVMALLAEATRWLGERGSDQWQNLEERRLLGVRRDTGEGTLFLVHDGTGPVGTITVDEMADADFWRGSDDVRSALYVHRMAVARARGGECIGSSMLDWAGRRAVEKGRTLLRLDAWRTNYDLHKYYVKQGFRHVRDVEPNPVDPRGSGALFERSAPVEMGEGPPIASRWSADARRCAINPRRR